MPIPHCLYTGDEAIALIREHHGRWLGQTKGEATA
jgi:hypothetical protein